LKIAEVLRQCSAIGTRPALGPKLENNRLSLPKMLSGANVFEISKIQEGNGGRAHNVTMLHRVENCQMEFLWGPQPTSLVRTESRLGDLDPGIHVSFPIICD
jgi:hypothetical protein